MYTYDIDERGNITRSDGVIVIKDLDNPLFTQYVNYKTQIKFLSASKLSVLTAIYRLNPAYYAAVMSFVDDLSPPDFLIYDNETVWRRDHKLIGYIISTGMFTDEQADAILETAAKMDAERH